MVNLTPQGDPHQETPTAWANPAIWDAEYTSIKAIPSSHRLKPSHAFLTLIPTISIPNDAKILDAGSGSGRHSLYLAALGYTVHAVDASPVACAILQERIAAYPTLLGAIKVENALFDIADMPDRTYDLVIDSYVSCHFLSDDERYYYLESLLRRLRPGGFLYSSCMGADDAYYREHLIEPMSSHIAVDPLNNVAKLLQTPDSFKHELSRLGPVLTTTTETFIDDVAGTPYSRQILAAIVQKI
jgi:SAM-dependent methyltransferase